MKRVLIWILIFVTTVVVSAVTTYCYHNFYKKPNTDEHTMKPSDAMNFVYNEMKISDAQEHEFNLVMDDYHSNYKRYAKSERSLRYQFMMELASSVPDSSSLVQIADSIGKVEEHMMQIVLVQYNGLKKILSPEQMMKMKGLYFEMAGVYRQKK
jgi:hypothetical protein